MRKYVHGDKVEFTSDYVEGDIIKFEFSERNQSSKIEYSKIIKVKPRINDDKTLMLSYVTESGRHIELSQIKEMIRRGSI